MLHTPVMEQAMGLYSVAGRAPLDAMVTSQATMISYMDDFKLLMLTCLAAMPLVFLLHWSAGPVAVDPSAIAE